jgi:hypothetical protein
MSDPGLPGLIEQRQSADKKAEEQRAAQKVRLEQEVEYDSLFGTMVKRMAPVRDGISSAYQRTKTYLSDKFDELVEKGKKSREK